MAISLFWGRGGENLLYFANSCHCKEFGRWAIKGQDCLAACFSFISSSTPAAEFIPLHAVSLGPSGGTWTPQARVERGRDPGFVAGAGSDSALSPVHAGAAETGANADLLHGPEKSPRTLPWCQHTFLVRGRAELPPTLLLA